MSHTVPLGRQYTPHWITAATSVSEELLVLGLGKPLVTTNQDALCDIELFFNMILEEVAANEHQERNSLMAEMTGKSALSVATNLLNKNRKVPLNTAQVKHWAERNLKLISKLKELRAGQTVVGGKLPGIRKLRSFLNVLVEEGLKQSGV